MKQFRVVFAAALCALMLCACGEASSAGSALLTNVTSESSAGHTVQNTEPTEQSSLTDTTSIADSTTTKESEATVPETTISESETVETTTSASGISTVQDVAAEMGKTIQMTDMTVMAASMIGAEEGVSFKVDGKKFEVYKFAPDDSKLKEAESGNLTFTLQGFGELSSKCSVNGVFIMIYRTPDDDVIKAFNNIKQ